MRADTRPPTTVLPGHPGRRTLERPHGDDGAVQQRRVYSYRSASTVRTTDFLYPLSILQEPVGRMVDTVDCVVIGAGVVGLAVARRLARRGLETIVLEAEAQTGT